MSNFEMQKGKTLYPPSDAHDPSVAGVVRRQAIWCARNNRESEQQKLANFLISLLCANKPGLSIRCLEIL